MGIAHKGGQGVGRGFRVLRLAQIVWSSFFIFQLTLINAGDFLTVHNYSNGVLSDFWNFPSIDHLASKQKYLWLTIFLMSVK